MKIYLQNIKPISSNNKLRVFNNKFYPTKEFKRFKRDFRREIRQWTFELSSFASSISDRDTMRMHIIFYVPKKELMTKKGFMSKTSIDLDNIAKALIDALFDELNKTNGKLNDALIVRLKLAKMISENDNYNLEMFLEGIDLDT